MRESDALIVNGAGFEVGLLDTIEAATADGVPTYAATDGVRTLDLPHADGDADADADADADRARVDPHFFTDPSRMADAAAGIADFLMEEVPAFDDEALRAQAQAYGEELARLDGEVERIVAPIPPDQRTLVTNHEVFSYFADRYDFDVLGAVVPGGGTAAEPSAAELADLAEVIEGAQVPAIFVDTSSPQKLADALAAEVGDVQVVELFSESLGPEGSEGATFVGMARTNAQRIADALSP
jgi:zinc/manganese transport system substrate-binding protein